MSLSVNNPGSAFEVIYHHGVNAPPGSPIPDAATLFILKSYKRARED